MAGAASLPTSESQAAACPITTPGTQITGIVVRPLAASVTLSLVDHATICYFSKATHVEVAANRTTRLMLINIGCGCSVSTPLREAMFRHSLLGRALYKLKPVSLPTENEG